MQEFGRSILIIGSNGSARQTLGALLQSLGCEPNEACSAREGVDKLQTQRPQLVFIQGTPSDGSGLELVKEIRSIGEDYQPYLIWTGRPEDKALALEALGAGVDDFIDEPLNPAIVAIQLRAWQRIGRLQQENAIYHKKLQYYSKELTSSNLRLRKLAITDDLTGLPNRRYAMELMLGEFSLATKKNLPLACMVIDLDGLKQINDEEGQERGDIVLKTVAAIMKKYLPPQDIVCRISGDEFLVICPGATLPSVMTRADKLMGLIGSFNIHAKDYPLGLSIGVAERRTDTDNPQDLISVAEQGTHRAKRIGRNQLQSGHGGDGAPMPRKTTRRNRKHRPKLAKEQYPLWCPNDVLDIIAGGAQS